MSNGAPAMVDESLPIAGNAVSGAATMRNWGCRCGWLGRCATLLARGCASLQHRVNRPPAVAGQDSDLPQGGTRMIRGREGTLSRPLLALLGGHLTLGGPPFLEPID
jgi:hypothetical protein